MTTTFTDPLNAFLPAACPASSASRISRRRPRSHRLRKPSARSDGAPWPPDTFTKQFAEIARFVGMKGFRFHDVRHAFATLTLKNGTSVTKCPRYWDTLRR
jgi:integrase